MSPHISAPLAKVTHVLGEEDAGAPWQVVSCAFSQLHVSCRLHSSIRKASCDALAAAECGQSETAGKASPASSTLLMSVTVLALATTAWKAWFI